VLLAGQGLGHDAIDHVGAIERDRVNGPKDHRTPSGSAAGITPSTGRRHDRSHDYRSVEKTLDQRGPPIHVNAVVEGDVDIDAVLRWPEQRTPAMAIHHSETADRSGHEGVVKSSNYLRSKNQTRLSNEQESV
jgi:hypothetical protein